MNVEEMFAKEVRKVDRNINSYFEILLDMSVPKQEARKKRKHFFLQ